MNELSLLPLAGIGEITPGTDIAAVLRQSMRDLGIQPMRRDVLVVAQKIVSKSENRFIELSTVKVSARASHVAAVTAKDPRLVQLALNESSAILRATKDVLIVRHKLGYVMANAGIDRSNVGGGNRVLLLPEDPDASAEKLRRHFAAEGAEMGVVIADSFGRPWRRGVTNIALGVAGLPALVDRRGETDRDGRVLEVTEVALADLIASAAGLLMGEGAEGCPAVLLRGLSWRAPANPASTIIRPLAQDLFR